MIAIGLKIPYMLPLFLGMTFDARTSTPGVDIFDAKYVDNPVTTEFGDVETHYKLVTDKTDILKTLDVSGDLSLKIKSGMIDVKGKGSYLKNEGDFKDTIVVLATFKYTAYTKGLPQDKKPRDGWAHKFSTGVLGTHYVDSITYGAEMIASLKFVVHNSSDVEDIKGEVNGAIGTETKEDKKDKALDLTVDGKLDKLQSKLEGRASIEISFYGTIPLKSIPNTVDGLNELIKTFADQVKEAKPVPMEVQLISLTGIAEPSDHNRFFFKKNTALDHALPSFEHKLDELVKYRRELKNYARSLPYDLDEHFQREIGDLLMKITMVLQEFYRVMWEMDISKGKEQLQPAIDAYYSHEPITIKKYERLYFELKKKIDENVHRESLATSHVYVHWGRNECPGFHAVKVYEGFTFSGTEKSTGGVSTYSCGPQHIDEAYDLQEAHVHSHLAGIRYGKVDEHLNPFLGGFKDVTNKVVPCAKCYAPEAASITMFSAAEECPTSWDLLYKGYLMSTRNLAGPTTEYICVDEQPSQPYKIEHLEDLEENFNTLTLTTVHSEGILPSDVYYEGALIKCAVCSMRDNLNTF